MLAWGLMRLGLKWEWEGVLGVIWCGCLVLVGGLVVFLGLVFSICGIVALYELECLREFDVESCG